MRTRKNDAMKEEAEIILAQLRAAASRSLERVADTFKRWDADGGGLISRSEFRKAALALFIEGEQRAIDAAFDLLDADGNGSLSVEELSAHLLEHRRKSGRDEMSEKKASSSMATLPNPIKLSSLALSKSDSSLAQFKANLILRTAVSAEQAVEAARQTEHDWRVYETTKHHTQQELSRRIAERASEVSAQQEKRRQELLQEEARERLRLLRRLNTLSAERKKRAQEQESLVREQERLMRRASEERLRTKLERTASQCSNCDEALERLLQRDEAVAARAEAAKKEREKAFKLLNEAYEERRSTSVRLRDEMRQQDDERIAAILKRESERFNHAAATLESKAALAAQVSVRAAAEFERKRTATARLLAAEDDLKRQGNLLASSSSLLRLQEDRERQLLATREASAQREKQIRANLSAKEKDTVEKEAKLIAKAAMTSARVEELEAKRKHAELEVQARIRKGVQTKAALYEVEQKAQVSHRDPGEVRQLLNHLPGGVFLTQ